MNSGAEELDDDETGDDEDRVFRCEATVNRVEKEIPQVLKKKRHKGWQ